MGGLVFPHIYLRNGLEAGTTFFVSLFFLFFVFVDVFFWGGREVGASLLPHINVNSSQTVFFPWEVTTGVLESHVKRPIRMAGRAIAALRNVQHPTPCRVAAWSKRLHGSSQKAWELPC